MAASGEEWAWMYVVGSLLLLACCILLLLLCASSEERKKRQHVEKSDVKVIKIVRRKDVMKAQNKKWQEKHKKQTKSAAAGSTVCPVTIVITPPTPQPSPRSACSHASTSNHVDASASNHATNPSSTMENEVNVHDDIRGEGDTCRHQNGQDRGGKVGASSTSLNGIGDAGLVTSEEVASEKDEDLTHDIEPRPRLPPMERGFTGASVCIVVVDNPEGTTSGNPGH